jgi:predicted nucleic acid binding AN1-type Zn finger protein
MTATALQFDFDFDAPARRLPVRRPASLTLVGTDRPAAAGRGLTLDDVIVERWERLRAGRSAGCLVCGEPVSAAGACGSCGSALS